MTDKIVVFCTCGSKEEAERVAQHVVERRVAACASVSASVTSFYHWKGKLEKAEEWNLTIKSRRELFGKLQQEIRSVHAYETPEILALPVIDGNDEYLSWLDRETPSLAPGNDD